MIRSAPIDRPRGYGSLVPLALLCAVATVVLATGRVERARPADGVAAVEARAAEVGLDEPAAAQVDSASARAGVAVPRGVRHDEEAALGARAVPGSERAYLEAFRERERTQPGALLGSAEAVLTGDGPSPEKVALLRALEERHPEQADAWLARCVRSLPDESGPHADSVPSYALQALARRGSQHAAARDALARLAFDEPDLTLALRRRAASAFAGACRAEDLDRLRVGLAHEGDELLVAGALAALERRREDPGVQRVLDAFPSAPATGS